MSANYEVWCRTCNNGHGALHDRGDQECRALIRHAAAIAALVDVVNDPDIDGFEVTTYCTGRLGPGWFKKHLGHDLTVRSEYGEILDECNERLECEKCGQQYARCQLKAGHSGDHSQTPEHDP